MYEAVFYAGIIIVLFAATVIPLIFCVLAAQSIFSLRCAIIAYRYARLVAGGILAAIALQVIGVILPCGCHFDIGLARARIELVQGRLTYSSWDPFWPQPEYFGLHQPGSYESMHDGQSAIAFVNTESVVGVAIEYVGLPIWLVVSSVVGWWIGLIWWRTRSRLRSGKCVACKYDLSALSPRVCPECGTPIPSAPSD